MAESPEKPHKRFWQRPGILATLLLVAAVGTLALGYVALRDQTPPTDNVHPLLATLFQSFTNGKLAESYAGCTSARYRDTHTFEKFVQFSERIAAELGSLKTDEVRHWVLRSVPGGLFMKVRYDATFEKGAGRIYVTYRRDGRQWRINAFQIISDRLPEDEPQAAG